jgi:hypothetical protein
VLKTLTYGEFMRLVISASIDAVEYVVPILSLPLIGDLFDIVGLSMSLYLYGWTGLVSALELVPGLDLLPLNVLTWVVWIIIKRQKEATERLLGEA